MDNPNELLGKIENAGLWAYFHKDWLLEMRKQLRPQLPSTYHLFVESETVLVLPDAAPATSALPDLAVARSQSELASQLHPPTGTAAVIEVDEPCEVFSQYTLVIRRAPHHEVVAAAELLSPSNKGLGNRFDREKHLRKRDAFLEAGVNLLEIDALLGGERALPPALQDLAVFERNAWTVLHLAGLRRFRGFGWNGNDRLPEIPWLVEEDVPVLVDLQASFQEACQFNRWDELASST